MKKLDEPAGDDHAALETPRDRLTRFDPDVLVVERGEIIPLLADRAEELGIELGLQRVPKDYDCEAVPPYQ